jgi:predicted dehydrogenase
MSDTIRWGILATGAVSRDFAEGLASAPGAQLVAVGSRAQETADRFGDDFHVPRRYSSYEALAQDPGVDVVYIGTPHTLHRDNTLLCLGAGKAVICEKAFAINARQAEEMVALARQKGLFLMEAMWNRFHPVVLEMGRLLEEGAIGEPRLLVADFGLGAPFDPRSRLYDMALGGGALLDLGVYPVALASLVFGAPRRISTEAHLGVTGVDERAGIVFGYEDGRLAVLHTSLKEETPSEAMLFGSGGSLKLHGPIYRPSAVTLSRPGREDERSQPTVEGNAYNYEAMEVMRCLREGETESPAMTLDESLSIMRTMDEIRAAWGLTYPED